MKPLRSPQSFALTALVAMAMMLSGCGAIGAIGYKISPPEKIPAKYKLGEEVAVVLAENSRNPGESEIDAVQIAAMLRGDLLDHAAAKLVDINAVQRLRDSNPSVYGRMSIMEVGRSVGAKQVIYVDVQRVSVEIDAGNTMVRGQIETFVRVVDVTTGANRYPADMQQGLPVAFELPFVEITPRMTDGDVRRVLHDKVVLTIGRMFRDWAPELEGN